MEAAAGISVLTYHLLEFGGDAARTLGAFIHATLRKCASGWDGGGGALKAPSRHFHTAYLTSWHFKRKIVPPTEG